MKGVPMSMSHTRKCLYVGISSVVLVALLGQTAQAATAAQQASPKPARPGVTAIYTANGTGNNVRNATWGSAQTTFIRKASAAYTDGISTPAGADRISSRAISNAINENTGDTPNARGLSDLVYVFGQFIAHDLTRAAASSGAALETLAIAIPTGDPSFDPQATGTQTMVTKRSASDATTGLAAGNPRQQTNSVTSFLDGSAIYGSDTERATALRTLTGG
eukprot:gene4896-6124_t